eukprot:TRINITY_DN74069_c0_g1_i1.p1 TRINITY_DN74069_c0_g1~~TRINITY_DN74069_c0_g1_i1.p1  ORF type:complete len:763 (+),score=84.50 TRINITY_DN74069_c0_g1_i1:52-2340(+)
MRAMWRVTLCFFFCGSFHVAQAETLPLESSSVCNASVDGCGDDGDVAMIQTHRRLADVRQHAQQQGSRLKLDGGMSMWSTSNDIIVGSSCEYANAPQGGLQSPAATSPYIAAKAYCATNAALYNNGAACGSCFNVSYDGSGGTDPGRAGSLVIQIVDSGADETFDCQVVAFEAISGATTGIFPVTYEPVACDVSSSGPVATVLDGNNAYYTKMIFSDLKESVVGATLSIAGIDYTMSRNSGATWAANTPDGKQGNLDVSFELTLQGGSTVKMTNCFTDWPQATSASCSTGSPITTPTNAPTRSPVSTPTPSPTQSPSTTTSPTSAPTDSQVGFCCWYAPDQSDVCGTCTAKADSDSWCGASQARCEGCSSTATWCAGGPTPSPSTPSPTHSPTQAPSPPTPSPTTQEPTPTPTQSPTTPTPSPSTTPPTPTPTQAPSTPTPAPSQQGDCSKLWAQCGGKNWKGPTCCVAGSVCNAQNEWYSQCIPDSSPTTTPTAKPTPNPTTPSSPTPSPTPGDSYWVTGTWTTGYWDCCKPSCSWPGKGNVNKPTLSCNAQTGATLADPNVKSVCDGGNAASCVNNQPMFANGTMSLGFAAAAVGGSSGLQGDTNCGQCFELVFLDQRHDPDGDNWGGAAPELVGKSMVVQVTNIGYDVSGEHSFDLQIPSAGQGIFTSGCTKQFPGFTSGDFDCDNNYGGCSDISGCDRLPTQLQAGCKWRFNWYHWMTNNGQTNNPYVKFRRVQCPKELTAISGSIPNDDIAFPVVAI